MKRPDALRAVGLAVLAVLGAVALFGTIAGEQAEVASVLKEREKGARGRRVLNRVHGSELSHGSDDSFRAWHQEHAPKGSEEGRTDFPAEGGVGTPGAKVHFTVMHVVDPKDEHRSDSNSDHKAKEEALSSDPQKRDTGVYELMHHADSMLNEDKQLAAEENRKFAESKPKDMYKSIEAAKKKESEQFDTEAVDHKVDSAFKSKEAERQDLRSTLEEKRGDVAEALAHEFQAKIEQHKKELDEEKMKAAVEKTKESADHIEHQAAEDKDRALRDARLAGQLDDKADESSVEARRVREEESQSLLQLRQLNGEVKRAEDEAKRARADAHHLREEAHKDVKVATAILASATKLIAKSELAEARLALKAASKVETDLTIKAASFTGKAKLDILQSKLLSQAAHTHKGTAASIVKEEEAKQEALERLKETSENAENKKHEAEVRVRRLQDRLDLEKRRAKRRLARARAAAEKAEDAYDDAKSKYQDGQALGDH